MNSYDFDQTILKGNTVRRFFGYCVVRFPYLLLLLPEILLACILYILHIVNKEKFLKMMELFLVFVPNKAKHASRFWDINIKHIMPWYLHARRDDDLIISASPNFLIEEICRRLGVRCISSATKKNGTVQGLHCYGQQKVVQFQKQFGNVVPETFYSDSLSDTPMFKLAKRGYLVKGQNITLLYQDGQKV